MAAYYETDRAVAEYLLFHYGTVEQVMPWSFGPREATGFPVRCVLDCLDRDRLPPRARALDLGCAVGRSAFELARECAEVVAIDYSRRFIETARRIRDDGEVRFEIVGEGDSREPCVARVPEGIDRRRVRFEVGDATCLPPDLGEFDVVLAANLLDRVRSPRALLREVGCRVRPGGQLILTSPYTWLEEYTPRAEWLAGPSSPGVERLAVHLPGFALVRRLDLPFVIREHARKFQWSVAEATVWRREVKSTNVRETRSEASPTGS